MYSNKEKKQCLVNFEPKISSNLNYKYVDRSSKANESINMQYLLPVKGYEEFYSINLEGKVFSTYSGTSCVLKEEKTAKGYTRVQLYQKGKSKKIYIHKIQMLTRNKEYEKNITKGFEIDHWDGIRDNNHIYNLSMISKSDNCQKSNDYFFNSKFPNVIWNNAANKWIGQFNYKYRYYNVGMYETDLEAYQSVLDQKKILGSI